MAKETVDTRKLKDSVAEFLTKGKFEKAAEVLEQLVKAEPKEIPHRLKLGDAYRRIDEKTKSIPCYEAAGKAFAEQGQLIKAIAAFKVILEIDPRNAMAQKELADINSRRFGKPTLESLGLAPAKAAPPAQTKAIPLGDDAPLELDDRPNAQAERGPATLPPRPRGAQRGVMADDFTTRAGYELGELDPAAELKPAPSVRAQERTPGETEPEPLPDDAILTPEAEDLAAAPDDQAIALDPDELVPAATEGEGEPAARSARKAPAPAQNPIVTQPIADLLSSDAEEEIELLSITSEPAPASRTARSEEMEATDAELDKAFGSIAPATSARHKVPGRVPLFDDLSKDAFVELVSKLSYRRFAAGDLILREGEPGRSFFVIVEGKVRIYKMLPEGKELTLAELTEGAFFGEMALLSGAPRAANVAAETDTELLELSDAVLRELAQNHPQVVKSLKNFYRRRLLENVMAISPLFRDFVPAERKQIVEKFRLRQVEAGQKVIEQGKPSDGLYVVLHGSVEVKAKPKSKSKEVDLARLREGDVFGEISLLTRKPATATVTSAGNSILLKLPRENFQELVVTHPQILELVSELSEKRTTATQAILQAHSIDSFV